MTDPTSNPTSNDRTESTGEPEMTTTSTRPAELPADLQQRWDDVMGITKEQDLTRANNPTVGYEAASHRRPEQDKRRKHIGRGLFAGACVLAKVFILGEVFSTLVGPFGWVAAGGYVLMGELRTNHHC